MGKIRIPAVTSHGATWKFADFHPENGSRYYITLVIKQFHSFSLYFMEGTCK
jgi:hypothetical protein